MTVKWLMSAATLMAALMAAMLLAGPGAAQQVQPQSPRAFRDWAVACDNGLACQAVSLEGSGDDLAMVNLLITWSPAPNAWPTLQLSNGLVSDNDRITGPHPLVTDGGDAVMARVDMVADAASAPITLTPELFARLRAASQLRLIDAVGQEVGFASLNGLTAALLFIEERQHRLGTVAALVRRGDAPATRIPAAPAYPEIRRAAASSRPPREISAEQKQTILSANDCVPAGQSGVSTARLDARHSLAILDCTLGAYQRTQIAYLGTETGNAVRWTPAPFDFGGPIENAPAVALAEGTYDSERRILTTDARYRGIGDCGARNQYVWDGSRFRLTLRTEMVACQGSREQLQIWKADVVE